MAEPAPTPAPQARRSPADRGAWVALVAIAALALLFFQHRGGLADADAMVMAAGMAHGLQPGVPFRESLLYGRLISPGVYYAIHALFPTFSRDPSRMIDFLNLYAWVAGVFSPALLYRLYRRRFAPRVAFAGALVFTLTPLVWEQGCSFHPIGWALLLLFAALQAFGRIEGSRAGWWWFALASLFGFAALATRAEVALVAPALLLAAGASPGRGRALAKAAAAVAIAAAGYLALAHRVAVASGEAGGLVAYGGGFVARYFQLSALPRTLVWAAFGAGIATCVLALFALPRLLGRSAAPDARRGTIVALAWALPTLLFWLPNEALVLRHFLLVVPALIWIAAEAYARVPGAKLALATVLVLLANLLVPEAIYAGLNAAHPGAPKAPNGTFFSWHAREQARIERDRRLPELVLPAARGAGGAFVEVDWGSYGYLLYGMALEPVAYQLIGTSAPFPGATLYRYRRGEVELRMLMVQRAWAIEPGRRQAPTRAALTEEIRGARHAGWIVALPREVIAAGAAPAWTPAPLAY